MSFKHQDTKTDKGECRRAVFSDGRRTRTKREDKEDDK